MDIVKEFEKSKTIIFELLGAIGVQLFKLENTTNNMDSKIRNLQQIIENQKSVIKKLQEEK